MAQIGREEGRHLFGGDAASYDCGRPGHPARVYELLGEKCGLRPGARVLEIGSGTGQATRRLLEYGADVVVVEPDPALASYLTAKLPVKVLPEPLEDAELSPAAFDLVAAASSFHWIVEIVGLSKIHAALRPDGWVGIWWSLFGADEPDSFQLRLRGVLEPIYAIRGVKPGTSPSAAQGDRPRHGLDAEARTTALARAGFERIDHELISWLHAWDSAGIRALYASFSPIRRLDDETRAAVLDAVEALAEREFGGRVEIEITTSLYTARAAAPP